jgi:transcriptional regulator with XRE-family HTH domain
LPDAGHLSYGGRMATPMGAGDIPEWTLADRLRKAREHAGMKQIELANATGIARSSIVNYEGGKAEPRRPVLAAWAMATGVPLDWLRDRPDGPNGTSDLGKHPSACRNAGDLGTSRNMQPLAPVHRLPRPTAA